MLFGVLESQMPSENVGFYIRDSLSIEWYLIVLIFCIMSMYLGVFLSYYEHIWTYYEHI